MSVQRRNSEMVDLLAADFQRRYEPQFAWKSVCSQHQALCGLRGFWPTSSFNENGDMIDLSGQGHTLTMNGNPLYRTSGLRPMVELDGTGDYFSAADPGAGSWMDITGTETYVGGLFRGLTVSGWFRFTNVAGAQEYMISKWDIGGAARSYRLQRLATGILRFSVSVDGAVVVQVDSLSAPAQAEWFFAAARFDPSTELKIWYNDEVNTNVAGIPASIFSGGADFVVGGYHGGLGLMTGRLTHPVLCASLLPDAVVNQTFHQSRAMLNV